MGNASDGHSTVIEWAPLVTGLALAFNAPFAMKTTSHSLLRLIEADSPGAWTRLSELYRPFICSWLRRRSIPNDDAEDLAQEVMLVVARELPGFAHSGQKGAFRSWLRSITQFIEKGYWRSRHYRGRPVGGTDFSAWLEQVEVADDGSFRQWDQEHDEYVLRELLRLVACEFEPRTMQAFRRLALGGESPEDVAQELGMSVGAVYVAKSRVLRKLRAEAEGLVDADRLS